MERPRTVAFWRRNLPHWRVAGRPYFLTFRLKGSLPRAMSARLREEYEQLLSQTRDPEEQDSIRRAHFDRLDAILDAATDGPLHLAVPAVAEVVVHGIDWLRKKRHWEIMASVVMPNHVHLLLIEGEKTKTSLDDDMAKMKEFTGREANRLIKRTGRPFWTPECFDHWTRTAEKTDAIAEYIRCNPVKAGLATDWRAWPWTM